MPEAASPAAPPAAPRAALLAGPVGGVLGRTTGPMLVGMVAMITVNLVDTFWVSRLGTSALAAMTFTFPVEALVVNIAIGLMIGTSVAVARAVGPAGRKRRSASRRTPRCSRRAWWPSSRGRGCSASARCFGRWEQTAPCSTMSWPT